VSVRFSFTGCCTDRTIYSRLTVIITFLLYYDSCCYLIPTVPFTSALLFIALSLFFQFFYYLYFGLVVSTSLSSVLGCRFLRHLFIYFTSCLRSPIILTTHSLILTYFSYFLFIIFLFCLISTLSFSIFFSFTLQLFPFFAEQV